MSTVSNCNSLVSEHLILNSTSTSPETVVAVSCTDGYQLLGSSQLTCLAIEDGGQWVGRKPTCTEMAPAPLAMHIIVISALASLVALAVLAAAVYVILKNFVLDKKEERKQKSIDDKMKEISQYFAVSQDCVGMPPYVLDNVDAVMRGRSYSTSTASSSILSSPSADSEAILVNDSKEVLNY